MKGVPAGQYKSEHMGSWELLTWRDAVGIECLLLGQLLALTLCLRSHLLNLSCGPEPSASLLVHLCTRCYTINSHEEDLLGLDLGKEVIDVIEDG
jgi:hypothetical protein